MYFEASIKPNDAPLPAYHRCAPIGSLTPCRFARS